jgi:peptidyl-prolyl cis-trans isomerase C
MRHLTMCLLARHTRQIMLNTHTLRPFLLAAPFAALSLFLAFKPGAEAESSSDTAATAGIPSITGIPTLGAALDLDTSEIVARVNGRLIPTASVEAILAQLPDDDDAPDTETVINDIIDLEVLAQAAEAEGIHQQPEVAAELMLQYTQTLANAWIAHESEQIANDAEALRELYAQEIAALPDNEYRARHILVETEQEAIEVLASLDAGGDFNQLAQQHSIDPSAHLGWVTTRTAVGEIVQALAEIEVDTVATTPVQTDFGFHVVRLDATRKSPRPDFDTIKPQLVNTVVQKTIDTRLEELRSAATIERY